MPKTVKTGGVMDQIEARFKQVDVLPMVKHYMNSLGLFNLLKKYVPSSKSSLVNMFFKLYNEANSPLNNSAADLLLFCPWLHTNSFILLD